MGDCKKCEEKKGRLCLTDLTQLLANAKLKFTKKTVNNLKEFLEALAEVKGKIGDSKNTLSEKLLSWIEDHEKELGAFLKMEEDREKRNTKMVVDTTIYRKRLRTEVEASTRDCSCTKSVIPSTTGVVTRSTAKRQKNL